MMRGALISILIAPWALSALVVGCGGSASSERNSEGPGRASVTYSPEIGLALAPSTWEAMGLQTRAAVRTSFATRWRWRARSLGEGSRGGTLVRAVAYPMEALGSGARYTILWDGSQKSSEALLVERLAGMASVLGGVEGYFEVVGTPWDAESSPGLEGWIEVVRDDEREALALPSGSIVRAALGDYVYRQTGPTTALRRRVTLGARRDELIEVVEGLSEGDHVVSVGAKDLWILELAMVGGVGQLPEFQSEVQR